LFSIAVCVAELILSSVSFESAAIGFEFSTLILTLTNGPASAANEVMRQTLLIIPQSWFEGPLLLTWIVFSVIWLSLSYWRKGTGEALGNLPFLIIGGLIIGFLLPRLSIYGINPADPQGNLIRVGLAIRGYGVFLLSAIVAGIGVTVYRGRRVGISSEQIFALALWMILAGLAGARLFYLIQKREEYFGHGEWREQILKALDPTQGGLVVFGSLIGGSIAAVLYLRWKQLPVLQVLDLIAPGMALGLAIGRIGCLMNGCCFGGVADIQGLPTIQFPAASPPYMQQLIEGNLIGLKSVPIAADAKSSDDFHRQVTSVISGSIADQLGIAAPDRISIYPPDELKLRFYLSNTDRVVSAFPEELVVYVISDRTGMMEIPISQLPLRSLATHPTQIYSAVDAFLLSLFLWFYWYLRRGVGEVFGWMLMLHGISRFLLEIIRQDELGVWGTPLTISQWISLGLLLVGIVWVGVIRSQAGFPPKIGSEKVAF